MLDKKKAIEAKLNLLKKGCKEGLDIREALAKDAERVKKFTLTLDDLLVDFSKMPLLSSSLSTLIELARIVELPQQIEALFSGQNVNHTEQQPALHMLLRQPRGGGSLPLQDRHLTSQVHEVLQRMEDFVEAVYAGRRAGQTGKNFTDVVNIGIGGSDLGPKMAVSALRPYHQGLRCHFVSNIDPADIHDCLSGLNPETSLILVASKSWNTLETLENASIAKNWLVNKLGAQAVAKHFVALCAAPQKALDFGVAPSQIFCFWPWVGGRYSVWSSVGLSVMLAIGVENFHQFLAGAHHMDKHFLQAEFSSNIPVILGLLDYYCRVICGFPARAVLPYAQRLSELPNYLQQLYMESNGKTICIDGQPSLVPTCSIIFGGVGTNAQHAFFQFLHQGCAIVPAEFIIFVQAHGKGGEIQQKWLIANALAQAEALLEGRSLSVAQKELLLHPHQDTTQAEALARHQVFPGNRPSVVIMDKKLTPFALGRLLALYEHRVFVEACLMRINPFDQFGVILGKNLAQKNFAALSKNFKQKDENPLLNYLRMYL